ncbi:MAG: hypothetical protein J3K34DRAFT_453016 [Monoraphidium minutum]|nr:MAG: hypothetical protein J3K34DRAFT_453016 [Monoraphidium minutum]
MGVCGRKPKEELPAYDDGPTCPYSIKPSELFAMNENKDMDKLKELGGVVGLAQAIGTHHHTGLDDGAKAGSPGSADEHMRVFGPNKYKEVPSKNFFTLCWENLQDPIILLLCAAALISTVLGSALPDQRKEGEWIEGIAIWVAVLIVIAVGAGNDYQKDLQFRKLNAQKDIIQIKVVRGGEVKITPNTDIVVGDVMILDTGDKIIADGVLVEGHSLVVDEASLTGESDPIKKSPEEDPWCRSGTQVSEGSGRILVIAVGPQSEWGKTMALVSEAGGEDTPLQEKLADVAAGIGKIGFGVALVSFIALIIKWFVTWCRSPEGCSALKNHLNQNGLVEYFLYAVTIVVVAVPEGLPLAVTIALAYSMKKMMRDNNFVRVLAACETMGGATAICSDKTGTLTENRMTVTEGWFAGTKLDHAPAKEELHPELLQELALNCALNSKAHLIEESPDLVSFIGNRTECALLMLARKWGADYAALREEWGPNVAHVYGFTSARKMASVLVRKDGKLRLYNKGAAEWVLQKCVAMVDGTGGVKPMTDAVREELMQVVVTMASRGLRCICMTYTDYPEKDAKRAPDFFEDAAEVDSNLVAQAIVGIKDPVRAEVPDAVRTCQNAGIRVRMVTGDNIHTARHIARECGILTGEGLSLEGPAFRAMPEDELAKVLPQLQVLARSSPEDKLTLVAALKKQGEVVAVTGDGTNDAPALKESDVGLAMGIAGTEVAKEAADIVIMDDNFSSIVKSVLWGRSVFNSIRKFLQFQLTVNFVALVVAFIGAVAGGRIPLNVLQLLWVNLIMDTMGALALATEDPNPDLLNDKPHGRDAPLITGRMWKHILVQGCYQLFWLFFFMYGLPKLQWPRYWITDQCTFVTAGPLSAGSNPGYCEQRLVAPEAAGGLGLSAAAAAGQCAMLTGCGWPCGGDAARGAPACAAGIAAAGGPAYAAGAVPSGARDALCGPGGARCPAYDEFRRVEQFWEKAHEKQDEEDFKRADSLLFNAFIWCQIFNEINARRINDELNVFEGLHKSPIFIGVLAVTIGLQVVIMMTKMGIFFKVIPISGAEWGISIAIGAFAIVVSVLTRLFSRWCAPCAPACTMRRRGGGKRGGGGGGGAAEAELAELEGNGQKAPASGVV